MKPNPAICLIIAVISACGYGQKFKPELLLDNLQDPCGVAIQPTTGDVFVSESGAGRVFRILDRKPSEVVVDFPVASFELDADIKLGPLGLAFRGANTMIVGTGGLPDGEDAITVFNLHEMTEDPLTYDQAVQTLVLEANEKEPAEGDFFSLILTRKALLFSCGGESKSGWIGRSELVVGELRPPIRFVPSAKLAKLAGPGGLTVSGDGNIVVAQTGSREQAGDSIIAFYSSAGELLDKFETGLSDIVALAYGPRKKRLFALDFSWADPEQGGLYQLVAVDTEQGCEARLIANINRPTSMAFNRTGDLYITALGMPLNKDAELPDFEHTGQLFTIEDID